MRVSKESILKGEVKPFNLLLATHFIEEDIGVVSVIDDQTRSALADAICQKKLQINWVNLNIAKIYSDMDASALSQCSLLKAEVRFHLEVINAFSRALLLDSKLQGQLNALKTLLLAHAVNDVEFWWEDRSIKKIVSCMMSAMIGWTDQLGSTSEGLAALFEESIEKMYRIGLGGEESWVVLLPQIQKDYQKLLDKYERLESRLKDAELGLVKALNFYNVIADFLNGILHGKKLPEDVLQFLQTKWLHEMQIILIQHGVESVIWQRWNKILTTMVKFYQDDVHVDKDPYFKSILISFPEELELLIKDSGFPFKDFESFYGEVAFDFSRKASGIHLSELIDGSALNLQGKLSVESKVSSTLIQNARAFDEGQWFVFKNDNEQILRLKLLFKLPDFDCLLFVNLIGQKSLQTNYDQFAYLLSSKKMVPLRQLDHLNFAINFVLDKLVKQFDELYEARQSKKKRIAIETKKAQEELERSNAARKALIEADQLAKDQAAEKEALFMAQISDDLKRQARLSINSLTLGAWVDLMDSTTQKFKRAKLAVKYAASGRYVFVDVDGVVVTDCQRDELVDKLLNRKLVLLESDGQYEDRLASIIKGLRQS